MEDGFIVAILGIAILINFYRNTRTYRASFLYWLYFTFASLSLWGLLSGIATWGDTIFAYACYALGDLFGILALVSLVFYTSGARHDRIPFGLTVTYGPLLGAFIFARYYTLPPPSEDWWHKGAYFVYGYPIVMILGVLFLAYSVIYIMLIGFTMYHYASKEIKRRLLLYALANGIGIIGIIFYIPLLYSLKLRYLLVPVIIALLIAFPMSLTKSTFNYILPYRVRYILVVHKNGLPLLPVCIEKDSGVATVISAFLAAINKMWEDIEKKESGVVEIRLRSGVITGVPMNGYGVYAIGDKTSIVLKMALQEFAKEFEQQFGDKARKSPEESHLFRDAIKILKEKLFVVPGIDKMKICA